MASPPNGARLERWRDTRSALSVGTSRSYPEKMFAMLLLVLLRLLRGNGR